MTSPAATHAQVPSNTAFWLVNGVISAIALGIIYWVLNAERGHVDAGALAFMPALNATLNALSASLLVLGAIAVKTGRISLHRRLMTAALVASGAFLIGYLSYHFVHGDTRYAETGAFRNLYLGILASHVSLSIAVVPLVFASFWFAWTSQIAKHKRFVKWTLPIWLYVSVTGVVVFFMLRASYGQ